MPKKRLLPDGQDRSGPTHKNAESFREGLEQRQELEAKYNEERGRVLKSCCSSEEKFPELREVAGDGGENKDVSQSPNPRRNIFPSPLFLSRILQVLARSWGGLSRNVHDERSLLIGLPRVVHVVFRKTPKVYELLIESRSLVYRMALRRKRRYGFYGIHLGPAHQESTNGGIEENIHTHACIQGIKKLVAQRHWATAVDVELYRDAWAEGALWGESNPGFYRQYMKDSQTPLIK